MWVKKYLSSQLPNSDNANEIVALHPPSLDCYWGSVNPAFFALLTHILACNNLLTLISTVFQPFWAKNRRIWEPCEHFGQTRCDMGHAFDFSHVQGGCDAWRPNNSKWYSSITIKSYFRDLPLHTVPCILFSGCTPHSSVAQLILGPGFGGPLEGLLASLSCCEAQKRRVLLVVRTDHHSKTQHFPCSFNSLFSCPLCTHMKPSLDPKLYWTVVLPPAPIITWLPSGWLDIPAD